MIIGTLTTGVGVVTTINLNYLPQYLAFAAATQLTALKIEVLGGGTLVDLDADGLSTIGRANLDGKVTNGYVIELSDGLKKDVNVVMTFTNSAAQTPSIRVWSEENFTSYIVSKRQTIFANTQASFSGSQFDFISFENGTAGSDELNVVWESGVVQKMDLVDLQYRNGFDNAIDNADEDYYLDNDEGQVRSISYIPSAQTVLYVQSLAA